MKDGLTWSEVQNDSDMTHQYREHESYSDDVLTLDIN